MARPRLGVLLLVLIPACSVLPGCSEERIGIGQVSARPAAEAPPTRIVALLDRGSIAFEHAAQGVLQIDAEVLVRSGRAAAFADQELRFEDHVALTIDDGVLTLRSSHEAAADGDDWELRLRVHLPAAAALELKLDAGRIAVRLPELDGLSANVDAGEVAIEADRILGPTAVRVDAGSIRVSARESIDAVDLQVAAGKIDLGLPADFAGTIDANTAVGDLDLDGRFGLDATRDLTRHSAAGRVGEGEGPRIALKASTGTIRIR
jgi:hypothetical protein